tara:strand:- start:4082 stop:4639 length:558 start_codon:yes stop_codon:yes gene_type:complete
MTKILNELILYLRNPILEKDANQNFWYRFKVFISLFWISITVSFFLSLVNGILTSIGVLHEAKHATDSYLNGDKGLEFLFIAAIIAPIIEELIFRAPIVLFKNAKLFKAAFYTLGFIFAYVHIFNFEMSLNVILFSPLLVAPQFFIGLVFGYIRVRFGLLWSICLHGLYNGILISLFLFASNATS